MKAHRRVLVVAYEFPPAGGAGVQRVTKWVKYLPEFGWQPTVLTVRHPSVPVRDNSLNADIDPHTPIVRARTLEPGYGAKQMLTSASGSTVTGGTITGWSHLLKQQIRRAATLLLQPDPQCLWRPAATRAGQQVLRTGAFDAILATAPPFSSLLVASQLARRSRLPLLVDYRDEWTTCARHWENRTSNSWTRAIQRRQQDHVLRSAAGVIATTWRSVRSIAEQAPVGASPGMFACIPNGFDPADFQEPSAPPLTDRVRLAYIGTLWNLTNVEPLVRAVLQLSRQQPELAAKLELIFAGRRTAAQQQLLEQLHGTPCSLVLHDYVDHSEALRLQRESHVLTILLSDVPEAPRVMPAKVFESMAARRHVLCIAPPGELRQLLSVFPDATCHDPSDIAGLSTTLAGLIERQQYGVLLPTREIDLSDYDRREQTRTLSTLLQQISDANRYAASPRTHSASNLNDRPASDCVQPVTAVGQSAREVEVGT